MSPQNRPKRPKIDVLGVKVDDISEKEAIFAILRLSKDQKSAHYVVTVNSEFVMLGRRNKQFLGILNEADLAVADGWWVGFSKLILGGKAYERIAGIDLVEKLCAKSAKESIRIGFLGGFGDVAGEVAKRQKARNPRLAVALAESGDPTIGQDLRLRNRISASGRIDILFVAYGMGRQEFWIRRNLAHLNVGVAIGVGGAFDYLSAVKKRAPSLWQNVGLEWLWRLWQEPWRIWRMRVLPLFLLLVISRGALVTGRRLLTKVF